MALLDATMLLYYAVLDMTVSTLPLVDRLLEGVERVNQLEVHDLPEGLDRRFQEFMSKCPHRANEGDVENGSASRSAIPTPEVAASLVWELTDIAFSACTMLLPLWPEAEDPAGQSDIRQCRST